MITKFAPKDLVEPDDVTRMTGFRLPCEASGTNLTWIWKHNDREITNFYGIPFSLLEDGTLIGKFLSSKQGGTYQCFVKDEETGVEVFSRKLQVAVTGKLLGSLSTDVFEPRTSTGSRDFLFKTSSCKC